jgi:broad specificity phosphatase PhoE
VSGIREDTVIFSHFIAINAVIGAATGDDRVVIASLDNCSVSEFEVDSTGRITLVRSGGEADTLIR